MEKNIVFKNITFFCTDQVEKWAVEFLYEIAKKKGYKVKFSKNLNDSADIGIYCQDYKKKINSKFSLVMNHGMDQGRHDWPNHWKKQPWTDFDIGCLPGNSWANRWKHVANDPSANPKKGVYKVGWPKSDYVFTVKFKKNVSNLKKKLKLKKNFNILYAPSMETDDKQLDALSAAVHLKANFLVKHWVTKEDESKRSDLYNNIIKVNKISKKNYANTRILSSKSDIFECLSLSDILITDESSVLYEATILGVPTISLSDWVMRKNNVAKARKIKPSKYCYRITNKKNLNNELSKILNNINKVKKKINIQKKKHFSNLGHASEATLNIIENNLIKNKTQKYKIRTVKKPNQYIPILRSIKNIFISAMLKFFPKIFIKAFSRIVFLRKIFYKINNY